MRKTTRSQTCNARADLVLIDAPCGGTSTWWRNPDARVTGLLSAFEQTTLEIMTCVGIPTYAFPRYQIFAQVY